MQLLTQFLKEQRHVTEVLSPTTVASPVIESFGVFTIPYLHLQEPARFAADSARIYQTEGLPGSLFATDAKALSIAIQTTPDLQKPPGDTLVQAIQLKMQDLGLWKEAHLAGKVVAQSVIVDRMQMELVIFITASIALLVLFLFIAFRSWWGVVIPLMIVIMAVIWTLGLMGALNRPLDIMTTLLPTILFVVGMSDVIHVLTRFITAMQEGHEKAAALQIAKKEVRLAKLITVFTTSVGFLTLTTTGIEPVGKFGIFTACGVLIAYLLSVFFLPALLIHVKVPQSMLASRRQFLWTAQLQRLFRFLVGHRMATLGAYLLLLAASVYFITTIRIDATLLDDISERDPIKEDFRFFEKHFAGVRPFEMHLEATTPEGSLYALPVLCEIEKVDHYLRTEQDMQFLVSPVSIVKTVNQALNGGSLDAYRLPATEAEWKRLLPKLRLLDKRGDLANVISADGRQARLNGKMADIGSRRATVKKEQLESYMKHHINPQLLKAEVTGSAYLLDKNNESLTTNLMEGLLMDVVVVSLLVLLMFRSGRMILIALIPNLLPMAVVAGIMGLLGIHLKVSTAIIFTIAFGIAVDDTIHFMSKLMMEFRTGKAPMLALRRTVLSTGKAIIITSCMLIAGFLTLLFSSFQGTFLMGLLISLTLIFAVLAELTLLPVLVMLFFKKKVKKLNAQKAVA